MKRKEVKLVLMSLALAALGFGPSFGNPTGGSVSSGSASITTVPGMVTIDQSSNLAIINWQTFSIGSGETTKFVQPSADSAVLNRVLGGGTSFIDGTLQANGQVIIINGNGIVISSGGMVNTNGFIASTRDIADSDFLSGNLHFVGSNSAGVDNSGSITASSGDVVLIGKTVDNQGTISAPNGTVGLAGGDDVLLTQTGNQHVFVSPSPTATSAAGQTAVTNGGKISAAQAELAAANGNLYALAINNSGTIRANMVSQKGGRIFLTTDKGMVENTGTLTAKSTGNGGTIQFQGGSVWNRKTIDASGKNGGTVVINAVNVQNDGVITVGGASGAGGAVAITYTGNLLGSVTGLIDASGVKSGGTITLLGSGATSEAYLSIGLEATSSAGPGGQITVNSASVYLVGATVNANGAYAGGQIYLGTSNPAQAAPSTAAQTLYIGVSTTVSADATLRGNGGLVAAQGTQSVTNSGEVTATGRGEGSQDGTIAIPLTPISPLGVTGTTDSGITTLVGSPSNDTETGFVFVDPNPSPSNAYGQPDIGIFNLPTNTTLITSPGDSFSAPGAGAAYLFSDTTGALLSTIRGTSAGDAVGTNVQLLPGDSFVISTPTWNDDTGAVTFGNDLRGFAGGGGNISMLNSLIGAIPGDQVGSGGLVELPNSNYLVLSPNFNYGAGAVTWVNPAAGINGIVAAGNSLVGANAGDRIGSGGIIQLANGANYLVLSPSWGGGAGAITNGSDSGGVSGVVGAGNSLVGASSTDGVGQPGNIIDTPYGYYLALTPNWGGGAGAVTWNQSSGGTTGTVTSSNSLVGSSSSDNIGGGGIILLDNQNYVVNSPSWSNNTGAVTLGTASAGVSGVVGSGNSLVGAASGDEVGSGGIDPIYGSGGFLVFSPNFNNQAGAVTMVSDSAGLSGVVSASNSVVGANSGDEIGSGGIFVLDNDNVLVLSPLFDGGAGAVTWLPTPINSGTPVTGMVSSSNSLVGSSSSDNVGGGGIIQLDNGDNFLVLSPSWSNGAGAITNGSDFLGLHGVVSSANSLVGANPGDAVGSAGSVTQSPFNYYLVTTSNFGGGAGAVTWNNDEAGTHGVVGTANSLIGSSTGDDVGSGGLTFFGNGGYLVLSPNWNDGTGAATVENLAGSIDGAVGEGNSLVGAQAGDHIGSGGVLLLSSGENFLVLSPDWGGGAGAITNGDPSLALTGIVSSSNSLVGASSGDGVGAPGSVIDSYAGYYLVKTPNFDGGAGAVTYSLDGTSVAATGVISSMNSLVGSSSSDQIGSGGITLIGNGYLIDSPNWNQQTGAVTFAIGSVTGFVSSANSLVGADSGDLVGSGGVFDLNGGNFVVLSPQFNNGAGAVSWGSGFVSNGFQGTVSSMNSLVGANAGDSIGSGGIVQLESNDFLVLSPNFNGGEGAITQASDVSGITGEVGAANSLTGANPGDGVGADGSILQEGSYYLALTPDYDDGAGAVTWSSVSKGTVGAISAANSLVGSSPGDNVGSGGITFLTSSLGVSVGYVVSSPDWNAYKGAVTYGSAAKGVSGTVGAGNSLVGSTNGAMIGSGGLYVLPNNNYLVLSPSFGGGAGAITFVAGAGKDGVVSAANSLVGEASGDEIGSGGIALLPDGNYLVLSPNFDNDAGAVTFGSEAHGVAGTVGAANSLVGAASEDQIGSGGIVFLNNGNYLVQSPDFDNSAGAATLGSSTAGVSGIVSSSNSLVGGAPDAGEEYVGESANGNVYIIAFTTDTSAGGNGRVVAGSTVSSAEVPAPTLPADLFLLPGVNTVEASGFDFIAGPMAYYIFDPDAPEHGTVGVGALSGGAINSGHGHNIASGSSTADASGPQRLVTPGNGVWNIFGGVVHSSPPPEWISHQLQLNLSPGVYSQLNDILFGSH